MNKALYEEKFEPRLLSKVQIQTWQKLVASRRYLKVSALDKKWKFQFVLAASLPKNTIDVDIQLGNHLGRIKCGLFPNGLWLKDMLRGSPIETIQEPFRTAVIGVILEDFLNGLSKSSQLTLRLIEPVPVVPQHVTMTLYWQMVNDQEEVEIVGSLTAGEELISEICTAVSHWSLSPWKLSDSVQISVDIIIGSLSLSRKESASLEVGDTLLLGSFEEWRKENLLIRINEEKGEKSLVPVKITRSTLEKMIFSSGNLSYKNQGVPRPPQIQGDEFSVSSELNIETNNIPTSQPASNNMSEVQNHEDKNEASMASWTSSKEGETARWIDSAEVVLEFSLGRHPLSLRELKRLGEGHLFPVKQQENGLVHILLQGEKIGSGELVKVGDEIGILVSELVEDNYLQKIVEDHSDSQEVIQPS